MALNYGAKICLVNQYEIDHKNGRYLDTYGIVGDSTPPSLSGRTQMGIATTARAPGRSQRRTDR